MYFLACATLLGCVLIPNSNNFEFATFNFNTKGGVTLSDIVRFVSGQDGENNELLLSNIIDICFLVDVDILNLNENVFSCRNVIFSCVDEDNPLLEALLEEIDSDGGEASVANFEYGINNAIPHSKGGELLCPGNNISEGFVRFELNEDGSDTEDDAIYFIGLNNGNGRGSIDASWLQNSENDDFPD